MSDDIRRAWRISIVGNSAGGKTQLARRLAKALNRPVYHVDQIQFTSGLKVVPHRESIQILRKIQIQEQWIIDGYGPLDILIERLEQSDLVIFIDLPLWRHYLWTLKRQLKNFWRPRAELPDGANELSLQHSLKLFRTLWKVHKQMRPEMLRILNREHLRSRVLILNSVKSLNKIHDSFK